MAITHIQVGTTTAGNRVKSLVLSIENNINGLVDEAATMTTMIDGDGSSPTMFDNVVLNYGMTAANGVSANQFAKNLWDEINSLLSKVTTDASVTNVHTAILQAANKIR
jgi:hypothetical protein